jgi:acetyltransferase-like isoleucine patch superfamily enzyme
MKTGLGLYRKYRILYAYLNLIRFGLRKVLLGFDVANNFIQRVDKISLQLILRKNGATIGSGCNIETGLVLHNCQNYKNLIIGDNCHIGQNCFFDLRGKIEIDDNAVISMQTTIITHQDLYKSKLAKFYPNEINNVKIGTDCYIGVRSTIFKGIVIGNSSIVAGGSVVTKSIDPKSLVGGVPAKLIKKLTI